MKTLIIKIEVDNDFLLECSHQFETIEEGITEGLCEGIIQIDDVQIEEG